MQRKGLLFFLYLAVFATGASGLIFQVTWQKYLSRLLGSDNIATAIILATFLGGLSLGYYLCGMFSTRVQNHFQSYALLEGVIGMWCLFFPTIFRGVEALSHAWSFAPPLLIVLQGIFCSALLMGVPTICMGGTLPFLTRGIARNIVEATNIHARVYAINTAGAFLGTLIAGFYLIPTHGLPVTIMGAAFINLGASLFFYLISSVLKPVKDVEPGEPGQGATGRANIAAVRNIPALFLYSIAFCSGFYVMTLENVLIRITNISVGSSSYSFSLIVAVFILAIAVGSYIVGKMPQISRHALCLNQVFITLALLLIYLSLDTWPYWAHVIRITFQSHIVGFWGYYGAIFSALAIVLLVPVAFMGATLPLVFHELKRDLAHVGTHSGKLFAWNTLGNLTGSLIGGIVFYYLLNSPQIFLIAALLAACSTGLAGWRVSRTYVAFAGLLCIVLGGFILFTPFYAFDHFVVGTFRLQQPLLYSFWGPQQFFERYVRRTDIRFYKDGHTATVAVVDTAKYPAFDQIPRTIFINGKSDSNTIGDIYTLKLSAHLPALLAETRKNVMVIGLGTGVTVGELTLYPDIEQIDVAEISPEVVEAFPYFQEFTYHAHTDPRVRMHIGDAFRILARSQQKWDIIISEPSNPWVTGVDLLFTEEYYKLVRAHLTDDGMLVQWTQLYSTNPAIVGMILNTVQQEFSQTHAFIANQGDLLIVASNKHFSAADLQRAEATLQQNERVKRSLAPLQLTTIDTLLIREVWPPSYIVKHFADFGMQTMDNPRLHYMAGKGFFIGEQISVDFLLNGTTASYRHEYLMEVRHQDWDQLSTSKETIETLLRSLEDQVKGGFFFMTPALKLRAYLSDSTAFPLSSQEKAAFDMALLPLIISPFSGEDAWSRVGLEGASYRAKAQRLLAHVQKFRNWIAPYPLDGLQSLLQAGMVNGRDAHEKNWCTLQLALLFLQEGQERTHVADIINHLIKGQDGRILLQDRDQNLLRQVNALLTPVE